MISARGLQLLRESEGLCLEAYPDPASGGDPWTIGYGHTLGVKPGDVCTREQAEAWLLEDAAEAEGHVDRLVKVPLTQGQRDAVISFVFNLGWTRLEESTLLRKLNAGDYEGAATEFQRWNKGGGKVMPGLVKRRAKEAALFSETNQGEPMAPFIAAAIPALVQAAPDLIRIFGHSENAERNAKAAEVVAQIAVESTASQNVQEAVEQVQASPEQAKAFKEAVQERWFELTEVGGGVQAARKADAEFVAKGESVFKSPSFWVALLLLPLVYMIVANVVGVVGKPLNDEVRSAISNGVVGLVLGGLIGYYYGQTTSRNRTPQP